MQRITYGSVQTRRWLGFEAWQCAHSAVSRAGHFRVTRDGRVYAAFRALVMPTSGHNSLAWLSADPYIPVARVDRDDTVHNDEWAEHGSRCALRSERLR
jgi:hypothetical protein